MDREKGDDAMSDWIKHDGGPQPVADDVWIECAPFTGGQAEVLRAGVDPSLWNFKLFYRVLNQHLIDAARLEGIRLGLEAAARAVDAGAKDWHADIPWIDIDYPSEDHPVVDTIRALRTEANAIRALDPATIAQEADQ